MRIQTYFYAMMAAVVFATAPVSMAEACVMSSHTDIIKNGIETPDGVPNYRQNDFVGDNDCGPTAAAMLMGYYDANDWPCFIEGDNPATETYYTQNSPASQALKDVVKMLQDEMPYGEIAGTWNLMNIIPFVPGWIGSTIQTVMTQQDSGAANWDWDDDEIVSKSDIRTQTKKEQPMLLLITYPDAWDLIDDENMTWNSENGSGQLVSFHWMTILGFKDVVHSVETWWGSCPGWLDWLNPDDFFIVTRSGWRRGGDTTLWYHWTGLIDTADLYTVEMFPAGASACGGSCENECGGKSDGSCWCDEGCIKYGDCCDDYKDECSVSCEDDCGGKAPGGCWCDSSCVQYGDCCDDYSFECNSNSCWNNCGAISTGACTCNGWFANSTWNQFFYKLDLCSDFSEVCE